VFSFVLSSPPLPSLSLFFFSFLFLLETQICCAASGWPGTGYVVLASLDPASTSLVLRL
jgi:hypothetical protein